MTAIEAMLRNRPLTLEQICQIQRNLMEVAKPFNRFIADIYARSLPKVIIAADGTFSETIYPPDTLELVREIIELRDSEIKRYLHAEGIEIKAGEPGGRKL